MREEKSTSMNKSSREYRAHRRMLRKRRAFERKCLLAALSVCLIITGILSVHAIRSSASGANEDVSYKYYTSITVAYGDSLWNIADTYMDRDNYNNKNEYIKEVCQINSLASDTEIKAGQKLIVPYYSSDFVR